MNEPCPKILLVDDDPGHAELIRLNLARSGADWPTRHFPDGGKFLAFLDTAPLGEARYLAVLDFNMPGLNGLEVLTRLKANPATQAIPVIILSTASHEDDVARCYRAGCCAYLSKPLDYAAFAGRIHDLGRFAASIQIPRVGHAA